MTVTKMKPNISKARAKFPTKKLNTGKSSNSATADTTEGNGEEVKGNVDGWEVEDTVDYLGDMDLDNGSGSKVRESEAFMSGQTNTNKRKHDGEAENKLGKKKSKLSLVALTKPPTAKEMHRLRETENLFNSNIFRLQIEEMLKETKAKPTHEALLKKWLEELRNLLLDCKPSEKYLLNQPTWLTKLGIDFPIEKKALESLECSKRERPLMPPSEVKIIGSYASGCFVGPNINVDVKVEMPQESFSKEDERNLKYHAKRAIYLSYIAHVINTSTLSQAVNFKTKSSSVNPILEVKPAGKLGKSVLVDIYIVPQPETFKLSRFAPSKSKIDSSWYFSTKSGMSVVENSATPHFNATVLRDLTLDANEDYRTGAISSNPNIRDGILLLKVWLRQRNLDEGYGGFSGYIMSMYVIYLLHARKLNSLMSSYQIARNVWNNLVRSDWCKNGITLCPTANKNPAPLAEFHAHFEVVFVDITGSLNLCSEVSAETFLHVVHESKIAVACLDSGKLNSFHTLFLAPKQLHLQADHIIRLQESTLLKLVETHSPAEKQMDFAGLITPQALALILGILRSGLNQRVSLINIQLPSVDRWPLTSLPPVFTKPLTLGLVLNPDNAFDILDKGPEANLKEEAGEFRAFWGAQSDLRRFKDGSIAEVAVWEKSNATMDRKRLVTRKVVIYLLGSKLEVPMNEIIYLADQFDSLLKFPQMKPATFQYGTGENASLQVIKSFDSLAKQLRELPDCPLDVIGIQGSSAVFRYTDVFPPIARNHASCQAGGNVFTKLGESSVFFCEKITPPLEWIPPIEGIIYLGTSSKWPEDLDALRRIQAAFYGTIARQLTSLKKLTTQVYADYFDVLKDGFVFRLRISNQKEIALMKKVTSLNGATKFKDTEESLEVEKSVNHLPKLTSALHGLCLRYSSFGPACCLAKRWLRSQLLDESHFPDTCIELLVASLFLRPEPFEPANQPQTVFFRFLHMLASTNWNTECIILDLNDELSKESIIEIENLFDNGRASLPALFIATSFDRSGSVWTKNAPTLQILIRAAYLAKAALEIINTGFFTALLSNVDVRQLFMPLTEDYDVVISLNPNANPRIHEMVTSGPIRKTKKPKLIPEYVREDKERIPTVGFNPVQCYIDELRECYGEFALFFYDPYGGLVIGVLWKPSVLAVKDFKVAQVNGRKLTEGCKLTVNQAAIVEDFYTIGKDVVINVEVKSDDK